MIEVQSAFVVDAAIYLEPIIALASAAPVCLIASFRAEATSSASLTHGPSAPQVSAYLVKFGFGNPMRKKKEYLHQQKEILL